MKSGAAVLLLLLLPRGQAFSVGRINTPCFVIAPSEVRQNKGTKFHRQTSSGLHQTPNDDDNTNEERGWFEAGEKMTVPADIKKELYTVESNTEAAKGRRTRVVGFSVLAGLGLLLTAGNTALSTIAENSGGLGAAGMGWTLSVPFLTTKWGGVVDILTAGLFGTLVELEYRTRDENVERIWQEMQRREKEGAKRAQKKSERAPKSTSKGGKTKRKNKRLAALSEIVDVEAEVPPAPALTADATEAKEAVPEPEEGKGVVGAVKRFYKQADEMAAAQALLLNKKLEEEGIVEKITDESGLRVVGRDKAKKASKDGEAENKK